QPRYGPRRLTAPGRARLVSPSGPRRSRLVVIVVALGELAHPLQEERGDDHGRRRQDPEPRVERLVPARRHVQARGQQIDADPAPSALMGVVSVAQGSLPYGGAVHASPSSGPLPYTPPP